MENERGDFAAIIKVFFTFGRPVDKFVEFGGRRELAVFAELDRFCV